MDHHYESEKELRKLVKSLTDQIKDLLAENSELKVKLEFQKKLTIPNDGYSADASYGRNL